MNLSGYVYYVHKWVPNTSFQQHVRVVPQITQLPFSLSLLVALVLAALVLSCDPLPASDAGGGGGEGAGGAGGGGVREGGEGGRKDLELPASLCSVDVVAI